MAGIAREAEATIAALRSWLAQAAAADRASTQVATDVSHLARMIDTAPGLLVSLRQAVRDDQREVFIVLLSRADGSGPSRPWHTLAPVSRLEDLYAHLRRLETTP